MSFDLLNPECDISAGGLLSNHVFVTVLEALGPQQEVGIFASGCHVIVVFLGERNAYI